MKNSGQGSMHRMFRLEKKEGPHSGQMVKLWKGSPEGPVYSDSFVFSLTGLLPPQWGTSPPEWDSITVLVRVSTMTKSNFEKRGFVSAYSSTSQSIVEGSWGRNTSQESGGRNRSRCHREILLAFSAWFLMHIGTLCPGTASPTGVWPSCTNH